MNNNDEGHSDKGLQTTQGGAPTTPGYATPGYSRLGYSVTISSLGRATPGSSRLTLAGTSQRSLSASRLL